MSEKLILTAIEERHGKDGKTLDDYITMEEFYPLEPLPPLDASGDLYSCSGDSFCPLFSMQLKTKTER